ncbi:hypothetical protein ABEB36_001151 [Hypothenemus hampei]|uniref:snRNA-activating protein complex subunit 4 n=1 Tax=Hypothenemus hampei TaxID=57062 RepID=A0ABD1FE96_HYPHA
MINFQDNEFDFEKFEDVAGKEDDITSDEDFEVPTLGDLNLSNKNFTVYSTLNEKERSIINDCTDSELKSLLLLNRTKNAQLLLMYQKIKSVLTECQSDIQDCLQEHKENNNSKVVHFPKIWRVGRPFFKTADHFPCPRNPDTIKKHQNGEIFYYHMTPSSKWKEKDSSRLLQTVAFQYKVNRLTELERQTQCLKTTGKGQKITQEAKEQIKLLHSKLNDLNESTEIEYPPKGCNQYLDWSKISEKFLKDKFTAEDCQIYWNNYLHPDINKNPWTKEECEKLEVLLAMYNYHNWIQIALELGTNRTGLIVCQYCFQVLKPFVKKGRFSAQEDQKILKLVEKYRKGDDIPWAKLVVHFRDRTRNQLFFRYKYYLSCKATITRDKFTLAEDILMVVLVQRFGTQYTKIKQYFPNRSAVQLKGHYAGTLKRSIKKGSYTLDDDVKIMKFVSEHGSKNWTPLIQTMNRNGPQIRQRYMTLKRFLEMNPGADLEQAPRRTFQSISNDHSDHVRYIASKFEHYKAIPSLEQIETLLQSTPKEDTANANVVCDFPKLSMDELLKDFFSTSVAIKAQQTFQKKLDSVVSTINQILNVLQANLYIPEDFDLHPLLDQSDVDILTALTAQKPRSKDGGWIIQNNTNSVMQVLPPTLDSLIGVRNLLLKNRIFREKCAKKSNILEDLSKEKIENRMSWYIKSHISRQSATVHESLVFERQLYHNRFMSLFKFPAIMSLVKPPEMIMNKISERKKLKTYQRGKSTVISSSGSLNEDRSSHGKSSMMVERLKKQIDETLDGLLPVKKSTKLKTYARRCKENLTLTEKAMPNYISNNKSIPNRTKRKPEEALDEVTGPVKRSATVSVQSYIQKPGKSDDLRENIAQLDNNYDKIDNDKRDLELLNTILSQETCDIKEEDDFEFELWTNS